MVGDYKAMPMTIKTFIDHSQVQPIILKHRSFFRIGTTNNYNQ